LGFCLSFDPYRSMKKEQAPWTQPGWAARGLSDATHGRRAQGMRAFPRASAWASGGLILVDGWECDATDAGRALEELWDIVKDDASEMGSAALAALAARRIGSWRLPALAALRLYRSAGGDEEAARLVEAWLLRAGCSRSAWEDARAYASARPRRHRSGRDDAAIFHPAYPRPEGAETLGEPFIAPFHLVHVVDGG
jgi:hypothetical protein